MSKKTAEVETPAEVETTKAPAAPQVTLTIQDLTTMSQIIKVCSTRAGAFQADELEVVGALYNKLQAFLQAAGAINPGEQHKQADDANDAETESTEA